MALPAFSDLKTPGLNITRGQKSHKALTPANIFESDQFDALVYQHDAADAQRTDVDGCLTGDDLRCQGGQLTDDELAQVLQAFRSKIMARSC